GGALPPLPTASRPARRRALPRGRARSSSSSSWLVALQLDVVESKAALRRAVGRTEQEIDPGEVREIDRRAVAREVREPDADRLELVGPARAGCAAREALVRLLDAAAVGRDRDRARSVARVAQAHAEVEIAEHGGRQRMTRP